MGVVGLTKYFIQNIPYAFLQSQQPFNIDNLLFDLNSLIYDVFDNIEKIEDFLDEFFKKILFLVDHLKPTKNIFFAFDGVSPAAKSYTQINRRLIRLLENNSTVSIIDSNAISAGTVFMQNLNLEFKKFLNSKISKLRNGSVKIYYSSHLEPGEGEFKIFKFIKENSFKDYEQIIYGCDSDLILSSLLCFDSQVLILQERDSYFNYIYTNRIRDFFLEKFLFLQNKNEELLLKDIMFLILMKGSDYIAAIPGFEKGDETIDNVISCYIDYHKKYNTGYLNCENGININNLKIFFFELKKLDISIVKRATGYELDNFQVFKELNYSSNYSISISHQEFLKMSSDYIKSLFWNIELYAGKILSWNWEYKYIFPPFLSDIVFDENSLNFCFELSEPVTPYESLMKIIPKKSFEILPEPLQAYKFYLPNSDTYYYLRRLYRKRFLIIKRKNLDCLNPILVDEFNKNLSVEKTEVY